MGGALLVTGANGHLGRRLIAALPADEPVVAVVRSERARRVLLRHAAQHRALTIHVIDPGDATRLAGVAARCDRAVHLIGTIRASRAAPYEHSHQRPARALLEAAAQVEIERIVYLSILGADADSASQCLRARAAVEAMLRGASCPATIVRVPMVLGEGDRASRALRRRALARRVFLFRGASLEQPIYAGDVIRAMGSALTDTLEATRLFELAGPESVTRAELVRRAAAVVGRAPPIHSLPLALGLGIAALSELLTTRPPVTRDMLRVLDHDDAIDPGAAADALGLRLTPLATMLARCVGANDPQDAMS